MRNPLAHSARKTGATRHRARLAGLFGSLVLALSAFLIAPASPAMAGCARAFQYGGAQVEIDNCPGNGRASWGWVWGSPNYWWTDVYVRFADGTEASFTAGSSTAAVATFDYDIVTVAICNNRLFTVIPPLPIIHCSGHIRV